MHVTVNGGQKCRHTEPHLVQNLEPFTGRLPGGPGADPGLVGDRGRNVSAHESPAPPREGRPGCRVRCAASRQRLLIGTYLRSVAPT